MRVSKILWIISSASPQKDQVISAPVRWWYDPFIRGSISQRKDTSSVSYSAIQTTQPLCLYYSFQFFSTSKVALLEQELFFQDSATGPFCCSPAPSLSPFLPEGISLPVLLHLCPDATLQLCQQQRGDGEAGLCQSISSPFLLLLLGVWHIFTVKTQKKLGGGALVAQRVRSRRSRRKRDGCGVLLHGCNRAPTVSARLGPRARLKSNLVLLVINVE